MDVINITHQHNWDVARQYIDKERLVCYKDLQEAIAEAKKEADAKKEKSDITDAFCRRGSSSPYLNKRSTAHLLFSTLEFSFFTLIDRYCFLLVPSFETREDHRY